MNWMWIVLIMHLLGFVYKLALHIVSYRSAGNPTPANVADVYDAETYQRWKAYSAEKNRLSIISSVVSFLLLLVLLLLELILLKKQKKIIFMKMINPSF